MAGSFGMRGVMAAELLQRGFESSSEFLRRARSPVVKEIDRRLSGHVTVNRDYVQTVRAESRPVAESMTSRTSNSYGRAQAHTALPDRQRRDLPCVPALPDLSSIAGQAAGRLRLQEPASSSSVFSIDRKSEEMLRAYLCHHHFDVTE